MELKHILPSDIEKESFRIIQEELDKMGKKIPEETRPTVFRAIHTTADFDYADTLTFSKNAVEIAKNAIQKGAHIVTDTNMALSGINKKSLAKYGGEVHCFMADEEVARKAKERNETRAHVSMERALALPGSKLLVCGNAPTFLFPLLE